MEEHLNFFNSELASIKARNEELKQLMLGNKTDKKLQEAKHKEQEFNIACQKLAKQIFELAKMCRDIPVLKSLRIDLMNSYEALLKESKTNIENLQSEMGSKRKKREEDFNQIYEEKRVKTDLEIKQIRNILFKNDESNFQEQELERARDLELMRTCHARELEHEKAHHSCQAKIRQLELQLQDLKKRSQLD